MLEGLRVAIVDFFYGASIRHCARDEILLEMAGSGMSPPPIGYPYHVRYQDKLLKVIFLDNFRTRTEDLGNWGTPVNLRRYYKVGRDATLIERLRMAFC